MNADYILEGDKVLEQGRELPVLRRCDVAVAGGGPAGLAAAVAAARAGADVLLIESQSFLGGVATSVMMAALVAAKYADGISRELCDRMAAKGGAPDYNAKRVVDTIPFDPEIFKGCALQMVCEAGVHPLFYTWVSGPIVVDGAVKGIVVENKSGRQAVLCKTVIDCTGDADLAYAAGVPCSKGREGDHKMRPFSLLFRMGGVDVYQTLDYIRENPEEIQPQYREGGILKAGGEDVVQRVSGFYKLVEQAKREGMLFPECHYFRLENLWASRGVVICNTSRVYCLDGTSADDLTKGEIACREQIEKLFAFAIKYIPGFARAFIIDISSRLGVRETRRIQGEYQLTDDDAYSDARFDDAFMTVHHNLVKRPLPIELDVHMPEPIEGSEKDLLERYPDRVPVESHSYQVPYRVLVPKGVENLLVAGRTISVSHMLDSFTRNMIPCMRFGQAAGAAAALSAKQGVTPRSLDPKALLAELTRQGLTL